MDGEQHWRSHAACAEVDPELFFPPSGDPATSAKRICHSCPVTTECLRFALACREDSGVWAGMSPVERRRVIRANERSRRIAQRAACAPTTSFP